MADAAAATAEFVTATVVETGNAPTDASKVPRAQSLAPKAPESLAQNAQWREAMKTMSEMKIVIREQVIMLDRLNDKLGDAEARSKEQAAELKALKPKAY